MAEQEQVKSKWFYAQTVQVSKVTLELTGPERDQVHRVRLETDAGDITYKPRKTAETKGDLAGFETLAKETVLQRVSEFITENPMLKTLSDNCKKHPQNIVISYSEISRFDEQENEEIFYKYLRPSQFHTIYYEDFHGKDDSNLKKQQEKREKYAKEEL